MQVMRAYRRMETEFLSLLNPTHYVGISGKLPLPGASLKKKGTQIWSESFEKRISYPLRKRKHNSSDFISLSSKMLFAVKTAALICVHCTSIPASSIKITARWKLSVLIVSGAYTLRF